MPERCALPFWPADNRFPFLAVARPQLACADPPPDFGKNSPDVPLPETGKLTGKLTGNFPRVRADAAVEPFSQTRALGIRGITGNFFRFAVRRSPFGDFPKELRNVDLCLPVVTSSSTRVGCGSWELRGPASAVSRPARGTVCRTNTPCPSL